jgi:hypothetical protein
VSYQALTCFGHLHGVLVDFLATGVDRRWGPSVLSADRNDMLFSHDSRDSWFFSFLTNSGVY